MSFIDNVKISHGSTPRLVDVSHSKIQDKTPDFTLSRSKTESNRFERPSAPTNIYTENPSQNDEEGSELGMNFLTNEEKKPPVFEDNSNDGNSFEDDNEEKSEFYQESLTTPYQGPELSYEEVQEQKAYYLSQLDRMGRRGSSVRRFNMSSPLSEIKGEYQRIKKDVQIDGAVAYSRQALMFCASSLEMLNGRFDPVGVKLEGWSQSLHSELPGYDEVFEELYEKYHDSVQMIPEMKLMFMVGGSAMMFHIQKSFLEKATSNDNLMASVSNAMNNINGLSGRKKNTPVQEQSSMRGPSFGTDDLLDKLAQDDDDQSEVMSETSFDINLNPENTAKTIPIPPKKARGRPKKNP